MDSRKDANPDLVGLSPRDKHFNSVYRQFQDSTPKTYRKISMEICRLVFGPEFPEKAFDDLVHLQDWYRAILHAWMNDSLSVADLWRDRLPFEENELALSQLVLEARNNGIRRIQRRVFRERDGTPRALRIASYSELNVWCDFMFELLNDEDEHVSHLRETLTIRYDKGVAYRLEEERKDREKKEDKWVADMTHSFMKALGKGKPKTIAPDDEWLLVTWGGLAGDKTVREATVTLFIDAKEEGKKPHTALLDDMVSVTWKAMRALGAVCYAEPSAATSKQARKHLDAVKRFVLKAVSYGFHSERTARPKSPALLSDSHFRKILKKIHRAGVAMERLPRSYFGKKEEDLRDHLLTVLQSDYPNSTGETLNKKGKTDILVRHRGVNMFVGECKFWNGRKGLQRAIDQILGNLTWRDSKAAVVCFIRNQELKPVLEQILTGTSSHPCNVRILNSTKDKSWVEYEFHLKTDSTAIIHLGVLCFHFPRRT